VTSDEESFADELYATIDQLRTMRAGGMHIGSHGDLHQWLGQISNAEQEVDIERSLRLLDAVGMSPNCRTMCYPYGSYNAHTIEAISSRGFKLALTTEVALSNRPVVQRFVLPRLDTNHLPKQSSAPPNEWTMSADQ
jgi:peptidoglycan/xylan/chitin deacetylase (PgdA/CDA1 family)